MKISLIISTYNWPQALRLCLASAIQQTRMPDEIVIADDGSGEETRNLIREVAESSPIPVVHVWQEDVGFRKTLIINKAVRTASGDYIIQADGDLLLHPRFVEDHSALAQPGFFIRGGRSLIDEAQTVSLLSRSGQGAAKVDRMKCINKINAFRMPLLSGLFCRRSDDIIHVKGCNISYWKRDYETINGYNNDINGWGHEDIEFAARLYNSGVGMRKAKFKAIAFHLHHPFKSRKDEEKNFDVFRNALKMKITRVENGYENS